MPGAQVPILDGRWKVRIDTGGTFTDALGIDPGNGIHRRKVLSSGRLRTRAVAGRAIFEDPELVGVLLGASVRSVADGREIGRLGPGGRIESGSEPGVIDAGMVEIDPGLDAPRLAIHLLTRTPLSASLPPIDLRIATTRATNALLTRSTGKVVLVATEGFLDLPIIGDQSRPDLFDLDVRPPRLLPCGTIGVPRHLDHEGRAESTPDLESIVRRTADLVAATRADAVAVCLLHSWKDPRFERTLVAAIESRLPGVRVSCGADVSPEIRLVPRVRTTIADAALSPVVRSFLEDLRLGPAVGRLHDRVLVMTSAGGLVDDVRTRPVETLLSGPAAGVVGAVAAAAALGGGGLVGFDMGGTSTDVARADGRVDLKDDTTVGDAVVRVPSVDLHTVAAGGGSICRVREGRLEVGPESAGADPGPACYGAGGPLTLTDVNLLAGRADPETFGVPLDVDAARFALETMSRRHDRNGEALLDGFLSLADERMAEAIRTITTRRGVDPADHLLVAFGGAGGQHACGIADRLGIDRILVPADAGLLSAVGLHAAARERLSERTVLEPLHACDVVAVLEAVETDALRAASETGVDTPVVRRRQWRCRLVGQDSTIDLDLDETEASDADAIDRRFREAFQSRYGRRCPARDIEVAGIRVFAGDIDAPAASDSIVSAPSLCGPMVLAVDTGTTVIDRGWEGRRLHGGGLLLHRVEARADSVVDGPAATEIVACRLESIARDMGETLRRTALSVNVKERLDYSCGVVDAEGRLVVNAPHMPVHLGAMGDCVRSVQSMLDPRPGDTILVNHPAFGGSHLPDLTLATPVFSKTRLIAWVVNRAHHAEIGGTRPGSMPPDATTLVEEGVVFRPMRLVDGGTPRFDLVERMLADAVHPSRSIDENLADLAAQVAANRVGAERILELHEAVGAERFAGDLSALRDRCATAIGRLIVRLRGTDRTIEERLDDGTPIRVRLGVDDDRMIIDFTGSGGVHPGNLNAPFAVVRAAVLYVLRVVAGEDIPLNEGVLERVELIAEPGLLRPPFTGDPASDPAVAIGNTETSQRVVDALLRVFEASACSQGTMNNLLLGDERFGYYETICGGSGAGEGFHGCDGVHTHMTNTRITDPEILEVRYPLRLDRFEIRIDSGGTGRWRGGSGVVRELTATRSLRGSLLAQHRIERPFGAAGGDPGLVGRAEIVRCDGPVEMLGGIAAFDLAVGDRLRIETPGGGGWGAAITESGEGLSPRGGTGTA
ncbi:MAG: 5-oxoprolinase [Phycisphaera sp.]|nr:5-oxoprolinase [Phycisphaera sp.]